MTSIPEAEKHSSPHPSAVSHGRVRARFLGREAPDDLRQAIRADREIPPRVARLDQVHSAMVLPAGEGLCGRGDGLWTSRPDLALAIATADCIPLVIADQGRLAVVHAGWRGIVAGIVTEATTRVGTSQSPVAWIGPAIRGCCYQVGEDVAAELIAASDRSCLAADTPDGKPRIDLVAAVAVQLRSAGVETVHDLSPCTRCHPEQFWSYRRSGQKAGRNYTIAWLSDGAGPSA